MKYSDFDVEEEYREDWDKFNLWRYESTCRRDRSSAPIRWRTIPEEKGIIMLNVRVARRRRRAATASPPGKMSSYIFNLKPGDKVTISGPFGEFFRT